MYCCGENFDGQCGRSSQWHQQTWQRIHLGSGGSGAGGKIRQSSPGGATGDGGNGAAVAVRCGAAHCVAVQADGTLVGWGYNKHGAVTPYRKAHRLFRPVGVNGRVWRGAERMILKF